MNRSTLPLMVFVFLFIGNSYQSIADDQKTSGIKLLVAFDPYRVKGDQRKEFESAISSKEIKVIEKYRSDQYFLIDCGMNSRKVLDKIPHHAGAIVFLDGEFSKAFPSYDKKRTPQPHAVLNWGSTANSMKKMKQDIAKYSKMKGVKTVMVDLSNGQPVFGNPNQLKLTPSKGKTLLDIFLLSHGQFDYSVESKKKQR